MCIHVLWYLVIDLNLAIDRLSKHARSFKHLFNSRPGQSKRQGGDVAKSAPKADEAVDAGCRWLQNVIDACSHADILLVGQPLIVRRKRAVIHRRSLWAEDACTVVEWHTELVVFLGKGRFVQCLPWVSSQLLWSKVEETWNKRGRAWYVWQNMKTREALGLGMACFPVVL